MKSLFEIQNDLQSLFAAIEENEGELTSEMEEQLLITEDDLKNKIAAYCNVVKMLDADVKAIKEEKDRLMALQKAKEKTIERLKSAMITAVEQFGDTNKSGVKYIDYGTGICSLRKSEAVDVNTQRLTGYVTQFTNYFDKIARSSDIFLETLDKADLLKACNTPVEENAEEDGETIPIESVDAEVKFKVNLGDIIHNMRTFELFKNVLKGNMLYNVTDMNVIPSVDKKQLKEQIKAGSSYGYAHIVQNQNIQIR